MRRTKIEDLNHYEILNLPVIASGKDVEEAYLQLTYVYGDNSRACYGAISENERHWMIKRIQTAYETLIRPSLREEYDLNKLGLDDEQKERLKKEETDEPWRGGASARGIPVDRQAANGQNESRASATGSAGAPVINSARVTGSHLRNIRIAKGASLEEISEITKVKKSYLEAIEEEDTKSFPAPIFMKGFLKAYAKALGLNPDEISEKYLAK